MHWSIVAFFFFLSLGQFLLYILRIFAFIEMVFTLLIFTSYNTCAINITPQLIIVYPWWHSILYRQSIDISKSWNMIFVPYYLLPASFLFFLSYHILCSVNRNNFLRLMEPKLVYLIVRALGLCSLPLLGLVGLVCWYLPSIDCPFVTSIWGLLDQC